jgi:hypothetical protein
MHKKFEFRQLFILMDYDAEYRNLFTEGSRKIMIRPWLAIECIKYHERLTIDSYINPTGVLLRIEENNNEDIVFNGLIEVEENITEYGNITCEHIIFGFDSVCVISKLNVYSIDTALAEKIIYSYNDKIVAINGCGCVSSEIINQYFPNLIINFDHNIYNAEGLMCITETDKYLSVMLNMQHDYSCSLIESGILGKAYGYFAHAALFNISLRDNDSINLAVFMVQVTKLIKEQESKARLFKNANN